MWLFCGLGNPGKEYELTRHNFGFLAVEYFAKNKGVSFRVDPSIEAEVGNYRERAILLKPLTFMNLSGRAVKKALKKFSLQTEQLLVIYDDLDLPLGKIKLLPKGGSGGHRGVQSIIDYLGTTHFPRLRLGIGRPKDKNVDIKEYVLSPFSKTELVIVEKVLEIVNTIFDELIYTDLLRIMNKVNSMDQISI